jgi:hypothetical protein
MAPNSWPPSFGAIVAVVSIVEGFATDRLSQAVVTSMPVDSTLTLHAQSEMIKKVDSNWPMRKRALIDWFGMEGRFQAVSATTAAL